MSVYHQQGFRPVSQIRFPQDNASADSTCDMTDKVKELGYQIFLHLTYFLFPELREWLSGKDFTQISRLIEALEYGHNNSITLDEDYVEEQSHIFVQKTFFHSLVKNAI